MHELGMVKIQASCNLLVSRQLHLSHFIFISLDLPGLNGSHKKVVENMSKNAEKKLVWWPVLEVHHCKCNDKYFVNMSKRHLPVIATSDWKPF